MIKNLILQLVLIVAFSAHSQIKINDYVGMWQGKMSIYAAGNLIDTSVTVTFEIGQINDSLWQWKKTYDSSKYSQVVKDYKLQYIAHNEYVIDEGDGILLNSYLFENSLISNFRIKKSFFTSLYMFNDNSIVFEVSSGKKIKKNKGINSYSTDIIQRIHFIKMS